MVKNNRNKMPEVTCLGIECGVVIELPSYISPQKYDGEIRCKECRSLLHIKLDKSDVVKYSLITDNSKETKGLKHLNKMSEMLERARQKNIDI